jgi:hypothetical protein
MAYWNGSTWGPEAVAAESEHRTRSVTSRIKTASLLAILALVVATSSVFAGPRVSGHLTVDQPVAYGGMTIAHANPGGTNVYVFSQCWDAAGNYVYARYSAVNADNTSAVGPMSSDVWSGGGASCTAKEGYFTRNGFGRWVTLAETTFTVQP